MTSTSLIAITEAQITESIVLLRSGNNDSNCNLNLADFSNKVTQVIESFVPVVGVKL